MVGGDEYGIGDQKMAGRLRDRAGSFPVDAGGRRGGFARCADEVYGQGPDGGSPWADAERKRAGMNKMGRGETRPSTEGLAPLPCGDAVLSAFPEFHRRGYHPEAFTPKRAGRRRFDGGSQPVSGAPSGCFGGIPSGRAIRGALRRGSRSREAGGQIPWKRG